MKSERHFYHNDTLKKNWGDGLEAMSEGDRHAKCIQQKGVGPLPEIRVLVRDDRLYVVRKQKEGS